jgi:hypothetical protein
VLRSMCDGGGSAQVVTHDIADRPTDRAGDRTGRTSRPFSEVLEADQVSGGASESATVSVARRRQLAFRPVSSPGRRAVGAGSRAGRRPDRQGPGRRRVKRRRTSVTSRRRGPGRRVPVLAQGHDRRCCQPRGATQVTVELGPRRLGGVVLDGRLSLVAHRVDARAQVADVLRLGQGVDVLVEGGQGGSARRRRAD